MKNDRKNGMIFGMLAAALVACSSSDASDAEAQRPAGSSSPSAPLDFVVKFDAAKLELPAGLAVRDRTAYVAFVPTGAIVKVDLPTGAVSPFGSVKPAARDGSAFTAGIALDAKGGLFAAFAAFDPASKPGIYRIGAEGGEATLFASHPGMVFPNALVFDDGGDLFVTDSAAGAIFRVDPRGSVTPWLTHSLLAGGRSSCPGKAFEPMPVGANGIDLRDGVFYVANTDAGTIVRIPKNPGGSAGAPSVLAGPDCAKLWRADGLVVDDDGSVLAVSNKDRLLRIDPKGVVTTLADGGPLDFPGSVAIEHAGGERRLVITNAALEKGLTGGTAAPGLLRYRPTR